MPTKARYAMSVRKSFINNSRAYTLAFVFLKMKAYTSPAVHAGMYKLVYIYLKFNSLIVNHTYRFMYIFWILMNIFLAPWYLSNINQHHDVKTNGWLYLKPHKHIFCNNFQFAIWGEFADTVPIQLIWQIHLIKNWRASFYVAKPKENYHMRVFTVCSCVYDSSHACMYFAEGNLSRRKDNNYLLSCPHAQIYICHRKILTEHLLVWTYIILFTYWRWIKNTSYTIHKQLLNQITIKTQLGTCNFAVAIYRRPSKSLHVLYIPFHGGGIQSKWFLTNTSVPRIILEKVLMESDIHAYNIRS